MPPLVAAAVASLGTVAHRILEKQQQQDYFLRTYSIAEVLVVAVVVAVLVLVLADSEH